MSDKVYTLDELKSIAASIARGYGITALYLFGSYARGKATATSDLDLGWITDSSLIRLLSTASSPTAKMAFNRSWMS